MVANARVLNCLDLNRPTSVQSSIPKLPCKPGRMRRHEEVNNVSGRRPCTNVRGRYTASFALCDGRPVVDGRAEEHEMLAVYHNHTNSIYLLDSSTN